MNDFSDWTDNNTIYHIIYEYVWMRKDQYGVFYADFYRISALTTYFTSVWIWLFIIAAPVGRLLFSLRGILTRWGRLFKVKDHPVATLGYTLAAITFVLHCLFYAGFLLAGAPESSASQSQTSISIPAPVT